MTGLYVIKKWRFGNCFGPENDGCEMDAATANWLQGRLIRPNQDYARYQRILDPEFNISYNISIT
jgi:hypothetical protein